MSKTPLFRGGLAVLALALTAVPAAAAELVTTFQGTGSTVTREFEVDGPWLLTWRVGSDFPGRLGFELNLLDSMSRRPLGKIKKLRDTGNGLRLFNESGRFRFRVDASLANWHLRIEQLTPEEAAEYTPIPKAAPPTL